MGIEKWQTQICTAAACNFAAAAACTFAAAAATPSNIAAASDDDEDEFA